jgi:atypical dual specificity phosphatase
MSKGLPYINFGWLIENQLAGSRGPQYSEHLQFLWGQGIRALVRVTAVPRVTAAQINHHGLLDRHLILPDMEAPSMSQMEDLLAFINKCLSDGKPVGVSCDGGMGRTATVLSCYLVSTGLSAEEAVREVKAKRPGSILTDSQRSAIEGYALKQSRNKWLSSIASPFTIDSTMDHHRLNS